MKKVNLNLAEFEKNSNAISNFLSKKAMSEISGGGNSEDQPYSKVPPAYSDTTYVRA